MALKSQEVPLGFKKRIRGHWQCVEHLGYLFLSGGRYAIAVLIRKVGLHVVGKIAENRNLKARSDIADLLANRRFWALPFGRIPFQAELDDHLGELVVQHLSICAR